MPIDWTKLTNKPWNVQHVQAQAPSVPRRINGRDRNDAAWTNKSWLSWFLDNHSIDPLIPLGVWKAKRYIVADYGDRDEEITAMRAAYELDGEEGVVAILGAVMVGDLPEGAVVPELPPTWNAQQRYRYQEYRDPASRPQLFGVKRKDDA